MRKTAIRAIREFCVQCTVGDMEAIRECAPVPGIGACPLWPYRMGKNPNISEATRAKMRELAKSRNFGVNANTVQAKEGV